MSKLQEKLEKYYIDILTLMYDKSNPQMDLKWLMETGKSMEEGFFMHYYLPMSDFDNISEDYLKNKKLSAKAKNAMLCNLTLGASPASTDFYYELTRLNDGLVFKADRIRWIEFGEDNKGKDWFHNIAVGRSLIMSPFNDFFTWQTTPVVEIIEDNYSWGAHFKTINSQYKLERIIKNKYEENI
jgi:hypothetical protein